MDTPRKLSLCPRCGAPVDCGMANGDAECWCTKSPPLIAVPIGDSDGCYCKKCLREIIKAKSAMSPDPPAPR